MTTSNPEAKPDLKQIMAEMDAKQQIANAPYDNYIAQLMSYGTYVDDDYERTVFLDGVVDQEAEVTLTLHDGSSQTGIVHPHPTAPGWYYIGVIDGPARERWMFAVEDVKEVMFE